MSCLARRVPVAVRIVDELDGVAAHLPPALRMLGPNPTDAHHGVQADVGRQMAERADARPIGLLDGNTAKPRSSRKRTATSVPRRSAWDPATNAGGLVAILRPPSSVLSPDA